MCLGYHPYLHTVCYSLHPSLLTCTWPITPFFSSLLNFRAPGSLALRYNFKPPTAAGAGARKRLVRFWKTTERQTTRHHPVHQRHRLVDKSLSWNVKRGPEKRASPKLNRRGATFVICSLLLSAVADLCDEVSRRNEALCCTVQYPDWQRMMEKDSCRC